MTAPLRQSVRPDDAQRDERGPVGSSVGDGPHRIAADGQRVVNHRHDLGDRDRAEIRRNAESMMAASRAEREREPSVRFWSSRRAQAGPLLALLAGLYTLAIRTWPIAPPQARGTLGIGWEIGVALAGLLYLAGFFLADRHWRRARLVLVCGAVLQVGISFLASMLVEAQAVAPMWQSMLFDVAPAVVASVAATLVRPAPGE